MRRTAAAAALLTAALVVTGAASAPAAQIAAGTDTTYAAGRIVLVTAYASAVFDDVVVDGAALAPARPVIPLPLAGGPATIEAMIKREGVTTSAR
ncbi:hypothetical protein GCM10010169_44610 [Micromonospora fulviviridis]|uniref:hypothetical protein n=1 Tax=Micromonospora fulviviridis TaxID=47860 RepID=UPI001663F4D6|nr:hypothetical protein [Micromonospora fulviviridis]GGR95120.1 hypothetical protein GCM10010169_44610 [Micromonospora fulviviridis]